MLCDFTRRTKLFRNETLAQIFAEKMLGNTEIQGCPQIRFPASLKGPEKGIAVFPDRRLEEGEEEELEWEIFKHLTASALTNQGGAFTKTDHLQLGPVKNHVPCHP